MGQEDETSKSKNDGGAGAGGSRKGAGRPCKRPKPKKVPQRGLGVAQLEKIRLEEEEREKAAASAIGSSSNSPCDLRLHFPNFPLSNHPSPPNSLPSSTVSLANSAASEPCWHGVPPLGRLGGPHLWAHHNIEFENKHLGMDPKLTLGSSLPCESNPISSSFNWVQRTQQQHPSSSMVRCVKV